MVERRIKISDKKKIMAVFELKNEDQFYGFVAGMMAFLSMETFRHAEDIMKLDRDVQTLLNKYKVELPTIKTLKGLFVEVD